MRKILLVDDDLRVIDAMKRKLHKQYSIETAGGPKEALKAIMEDAYAVVVSDLNMPGMSGIEFLRQVKFLAPQVIGILLTGQADLESAISAVNEGHVYRFLRKPCPQELLTSTLDAALKQFDLVHAEKYFMQETVLAMLDMLINVLAVGMPMIFGRTKTITQLAHDIAAELGLSHAWELEAAALLSQVGCVAVPAPILNKYNAGVDLTHAEAEAFNHHPQIGRESVARVPRMGLVAEIVGRQLQPLDDAQSYEPQRLKVFVCSRVLRAALVYDRLQAAGLSTEDALCRMRNDYGEPYGAHVLDALGRVAAKVSRSECSPAESNVIDLKNNAHCTDCEL
ncbi:MAG TPA: HD domain-containing phosphohydrolase [Candidatus Binataceae bacterium]|nr:HD domain-containing phosphohydrolase [Candidatus Binataceae bacterium]